MSYFQRCASDICTSIADIAASTSPRYLYKLLQPSSKCNITSSILHCCGARPGSSCNGTNEYDHCSGLDVSRIPYHRIVHYSMLPLFVSSGLSWRTGNSIAKLYCLENVGAGRAGWFLDIARLCHLANFIVSPHYARRDVLFCDQLCFHHKIGAVPKM